MNLVNKLLTSRLHCVIVEAVSTTDATLVNGPIARPLRSRSMKNNTFFIHTASILYSNTLAKLPGPLTRT